MVHAYEVGKPYSPGRRRWPEAVEYNYRQGAHELRMFLGNLRSRDIRDVTKGACEFAIAPRGNVLFFLYRFGEAIPWSDAPYSWHMVPAEQRSLPEPDLGEERRDTLQIILVDADTGIVRGLRLVSFLPSFSAALRLAIREQAERPWPGQAAYDRELAALYRVYPTSRDLLAVATARTTGGA